MNIARDMISIRTKILLNLFTLFSNCQNKSIKKIITTTTTRTVTTNITAVSIGTCQHHRYFLT